MYSSKNTLQHVLLKHVKEEEERRRLWLKKKHIDYIVQRKTQREKLTVQQKLEPATTLKQGNSKNYTQERS